jgi:hypothetical protein
MLQIVQTVAVGRLLSALHTHKCLSSIRQKSLPVSVARWSACCMEIWGSYDGDGCLLATRCFILFLTSLIRGDTMIKRIYIHVVYLPCRNSSDRWTASRETCVLSCLRLVCGSLNLLLILFCYCLQTWGEVLCLYCHMLHMKSHLSQLLWSGHNAVSNR